MFLNVLYSWLIAQILHPILFAVSLWLLNGRFFLDAGYIFCFTAVSFVVSLPCLLLGWLCMGFIIHYNYTITGKFFIWLATSAVLVLLTLWIIILSFDGGVDPEALLAALPGILSIWLASVIRWKQFHKLNLGENTSPENTKAFETETKDV